ncbi:MAG TPA: hypothetical protein VFL66_03045 [Gaiellaceae bacterium]|nr:hypothetical protein [Gaiellaceae bacterium]
MVACSPRISPLLLVALERLDDPSVPIAETARRLGREADRLGLTRPSYDRVRELVHERRGALRLLAVVEMLAVVTSRPEHGSPRPP